jgi:hypothetical protein
VLMTVILMMEAVQDLKIMAFSSTLIRLIAWETAVHSISSWHY